MPRGFTTGGTGLANFNPKSHERVFRKQLGPTMKKRTIVIALMAVAYATAVVGTGYSLFGGASYFAPGNASSRAVQLTSDLSNVKPVDDYSGVDFAVVAEMKLSDVTNLATDYNFTHNSCGGGSPRFQINVVTPSNETKNIFVYIGPPPNYNTCAPGWTSSGNLVTPASLVDTSQLPGGTFYDTYAHAQTLYSTYPVTGIQLVADAAWAFTDQIQTVLVDNVQINNGTYNFEPGAGDACKNGGWQSFTSAPGPFKNQGDCVSYFNQ
jgi:hypothetical protein